MPGAPSQASTKPHACGTTGRSPILLLQVMGLLKPGCDAMTRASEEDDGQQSQRLKWAKWREERGREIKTTIKS